MNSNNKGCNPFGGCIITIVVGYILTMLLIGAVDSCNSIGDKAAYIASEGIFKLFMLGCFYVIGFALFYNED
jgi:hypothetical protein